MDNRLRQTIVVYINTPPRPGASRNKLNEAIHGLRVYGKGANKNKLIIRCLFWTRLRFKSCYSKGWVSPGLDKLPHRTPKERKVELDHFPIRLSEPMNLGAVKRRHETRGGHFTRPDLRSGRDRNPIELRSVRVKLDPIRIPNRVLKKKKT